MDIVHTLLSHIVVILLAGAIVGAAAWAYTTYKVPKMYKVTVTFYALSKITENNEAAGTTDIAKSRQLASTYSYVLRSNLVMKDAADRLAELGVKTPGGAPYSYGALKGMTAVSTTNTEIFTATFTSTDRQNLQKVANTIAEVGGNVKLNLTLTVSKGATLHHTEDWSLCLRRTSLRIGCTH